MSEPIFSVLSGKGGAQDIVLSFAPGAICPEGNGGNDEVDCSFYWGGTFAIRIVDGCTPVQPIGYDNFSYNTYIARAGNIWVIYHGSMLADYYFTAPANGDYPPTTGWTVVYGDECCGTTAAVPTVTYTGSCGNCFGC